MPAGHDSLVKMICMCKALILAETTSLETYNVIKIDYRLTFDIDRITDLSYTHRRNKNAN